MDLPASMHVVLITRADPPLPLSRLRARGQLLEIRMSDLRFTEAEAAAFLNQVMGLHLTVEDVRALEERTEGWTVGLQMAALALQSTDMRSSRQSAAGRSGPACASARPNHPAKADPAPGMPPREGASRPASPRARRPRGRARVAQPGNFPRGGSAREGGPPSHCPPRGTGRRIRAPPRRGYIPPGG